MLSDCMQLGNLWQDACVTRKQILQDMCYQIMGGTIIYVKKGYNISNSRVRVGNPLLSNIWKLSLLQYVN